MPSFAINTSGFQSREPHAELAESASFASVEDIQFEITDFASPDTLDRGLAERVSAIIKALGDRAYSFSEDLALVGRKTGSNLEQEIGFIDRTGTLVISAILAMPAYTTGRSGG